VAATPSAACNSARVSSATITVASKRRAAVISQAGDAILSWHREDGTVSLRITLLEDLV
jgi:hypothetical protein